MTVTVKSTGANASGGDCLGRQAYRQGTYKSRTHQMDLLVSMVLLVFTAAGLQLWNPIRASASRPEVR